MLAGECNLFYRLHNPTALSPELQPCPEEREEALQQLRSGAARVPWLRRSATQRLWSPFVRSGSVLCSIALKLEVLVATDVAARGLDVKGIALVVMLVFVGVQGSFLFCDFRFSGLSTNARNIWSHAGLHNVIMMAVVPLSPGAMMQRLYEELSSRDSCQVLSVPPLCERHFESRGTTTQQTARRP